MAGLRAALVSLRRAGCRTAYINGSFATSADKPNDYDACWDDDGVNLFTLDPTLLMFDSNRVSQKARYMGELFPTSAIVGSFGLSFLEFFQRDKASGATKGIIAIDLGGL